MKTHLIDELRPGAPDIDPVWQAETMRAILEDRGLDAALATRSKAHRLVRLALIAAAAAVLVGGAIVARSLLPADDVRPAGPVQEKVQRIDPSTATTLELGSSLEVVAELPGVFGGDPVHFNGFAEDGVLLGAVIPEETEPAQGKITTQSHPVMYDLGTKAFTLLDDRDRPEPTWVGNVAGNETAVVWVEGSGTTIDISDFTIYSYDRRTKQVTPIGEFSDPDGQIAYGNDLDIAGDTAYFSTPAYPAKRGQEAVYAVPVDGSKPPSVIAAGGEQVRILGDTLTYRVRNPDDEEEYPAYFTRDLSTGGTTPVPVSAHVDEPGFCGAEFSKDWETWCVGHRDDEVNPTSGLLTIKEASGRTTELARFPSESLNAPIPHDVVTLGPWTGITMTTDDGQDRKFLVDLDTLEVKVFPDNTSFGSVSPDRSMVLISSYADRGPGPQRIVRIPGND